MSGNRRMVSTDLIGHGNILRANEKVSPVGPEYPGNIRLAISYFCEAGSTLPFAKKLQLV